MSGYVSATTSLTGESTVEDEGFNSREDSLYSSVRETEEESSSTDTTASYEDASTVFEEDEVSHSKTISLSNSESESFSSSSSFELLIEQFLEHQKQIRQKYSGILEEQISRLRQDFEPQFPPRRAFTDEYIQTQTSDSEELSAVRKRLLNLYKTTQEQFQTKGIPISLFNLYNEIAEELNKSRLQEDQLNGLIIKKVGNKEKPAFSPAAYSAIEQKYDAKLAKEGTDSKRKETQIKSDWLVTDSTEMPWSADHQNDDNDDADGTYIRPPENWINPGSPQSVGRKTFRADNGQAYYSDKAHPIWQITKAPIHDEDIDNGRPLGGTFREKTMHEYDLPPATSSDINYFQRKVNKDQALKPYSALNTESDENFSKQDSNHRVVVPFSNETLDGAHRSQSLLESTTRKNDFATYRFDFDHHKKPSENKSSPESRDSNLISNLPGTGYPLKPHPDSIAGKSDIVPDTFHDKYSESLTEDKHLLGDRFDSYSMQMYQDFYTVPTSIQSIESSQEKISDIHFPHLSLSDPFPKRYDMTKDPDHEVSFGATEYEMRERCMYRNNNTIKPYGMTEFTFDDDKTRLEQFQSPHSSTGFTKNEDLPEYSGLEKISLDTRGDDLSKMSPLLYCDNLHSNTHTNLYQAISNEALNGVQAPHYSFSDPLPTTVDDIKVRIADESHDSALQLEELRYHEKSFQYQRLPDVPLTADFYQLTKLSRSGIQGRDLSKQNLSVHEIIREQNDQLSENFKEPLRDHCQPDVFKTSKMLANFQKKQARSIPSEATVTKDQRVQLSRNISEKEVDAHGNDFYQKHRFPAKIRNEGKPFKDTDRYPKSIKDIDNKSELTDVSAMEVDNGPVTEEKTSYGSTFSELDQCGNYVPNFQNRNISGDRTGKAFGKTKVPKSSAVSKVPHMITKLRKGQTDKQKDDFSAKERKKLDEFGQNLYTDMKMMSEPNQIDVLKALRMVAKLRNDHTEKQKDDFSADEQRQTDEFEENFLTEMNIVSETNHIDVLKTSRMLAKLPKGQTDTQKDEFSAEERTQLDEFEQNLDTGMKIGPEPNQIDVLKASHMLAKLPKDHKDKQRDDVSAEEQIQTDEFEENLDTGMKTVVEPNQRHVLKASRMLAKLPKCQTDKQEDDFSAEEQSQTDEFEEILDTDMKKVSELKQIDVLKASRMLAKLRKGQTHKQKDDFSAKERKQLDEFKQNLDTDMKMASEPKQIDVSKASRMLAKLRKDHTDKQKDDFSAEERKQPGEFEHNIDAETKTVSETNKIDVLKASRILAKPRKGQTDKQKDDFSADEQSHIDEFEENLDTGMKTVAEPNQIDALKASRMLVKLRKGEKGKQKDDFSTEERKQLDEFEQNLGISMKTGPETNQINVLKASHILSKLRKDHTDKQKDDFFAEQLLQTDEFEENLDTDMKMVSETKQTDVLKASRMLAKLSKDHTDKQKDDLSVTDHEQTDKFEEILDTGMKTVAEPNQNDALKASRMLAKLRKGQTHKQKDDVFAEQLLQTDEFEENLDTDMNMVSEPKQIDVLKASRMLAKLRKGQTHKQKDDFSAKEQRHIDEFEESLDTGMKKVSEPKQIDVLKASRVLAKLRKDHTDKQKDGVSAEEQLQTDEFEEILDTDMKMVSEPKQIDVLKASRMLAKLRKGQIDTQKDDFSAKERKQLDEFAEILDTDMKMASEPKQIDVLKASCMLAKLRKGQTDKQKDDFSAKESKRLDASEQNFDTDMKTGPSPNQIDISKASRMLAKLRKDHTDKQKDDFSAEERKQPGEFEHNIDAETKTVSETNKIDVLKASRMLAKLRKGQTHKQKDDFSAKEQRHIDEFEENLDTGMKTVAEPNQIDALKASRMLAKLRKGEKGKQKDDFSTEERKQLDEFEQNLGMSMKTGPETNQINVLKASHISSKQRKDHTDKQKDDVSAEEQLQTDEFEEILDTDMKMVSEPKQIDVLKASRILAKLRKGQIDKQKDDFSAEERKQPGKFEHNIDAETKTVSETNKIDVLKASRMLANLRKGHTDKQKEDFSAEEQRQTDEFEDNLDTEMKTVSVSEPKQIDAVKASCMLAKLRKGRTDKQKDDVSVEEQRQIEEFEEYLDTEMNMVSKPKDRANIRHDDISIEEKEPFENMDFETETGMKIATESQQKDVLKGSRMLAKLRTNEMHGNNVDQQVTDAKFETGSDKASSGKTDILKSSRLLSKLRKRRAKEQVITPEDQINQLFVDAEHEIHTDKDDETSTTKVDIFKASRVLSKFTKERANDRRKGISVKEIENQHSKDHIKVTYPDTDHETPQTDVQNSSRMQEKLWKGRPNEQREVISDDEQAEDSELEIGLKKNDKASLRKTDIFKASCFLAKFKKNGAKDQSHGTEELESKRLDRSDNETGTDLKTKTDPRKSDVIKASRMLANIRKRRPNEQPEDILTEEDDQPVEDMRHEINMEDIANISPRQTDSFKATCMLMKFKKGRINEQPEDILPLEDDQRLKDTGHEMNVENSVTISSRQAENCQQIESPENNEQVEDTGHEKSIEEYASTSIRKPDIFTASRVPAKLQKLRPNRTLSVDATREQENRLSENAEGELGTKLQTHSDPTQVDVMKASRVSAKHRNVCTNDKLGVIPADLPTNGKFLESDHSVDVTEIKDKSPTKTDLFKVSRFLAKLQKGRRGNDQHTEILAEKQTDSPENCEHGKDQAMKKDANFRQLDLLKASRMLSKLRKDQAGYKRDIVLTELPTNEQPENSGHKIGMAKNVDTSPAKPDIFRASSVLAKFQKKSAIDQSTTIPTEKQKYNQRKDFEQYVDKITETDANFKQPNVLIASRTLENFRKDQAFDISIKNEKYQHLGDTDPGNNSVETSPKKTDVFKATQILTQLKRGRAKGSVAVLEPKPPSDHMDLRKSVDIGSDKTDVFKTSGVLAKFRQSRHKKSMTLQSVEKNDHQEKIESREYAENTVPFNKQVETKSNLSDASEEDLSFTDMDRKILSELKISPKKSIADELDQYFTEHPDSPRLSDTLLVLPTTPGMERPVDVEGELVEDDEVTYTSTLHEDIFVEDSVRVVQDLINEMDENMADDLICDECKLPLYFDEGSVPVCMHGKIVKLRTDLSAGGVENVNRANLSKAGYNRTSSSSTRRRENTIVRIEDSFTAVSIKPSVSSSSSDSCILSRAGTGSTEHSYFKLKGVKKICYCRYLSCAKIWLIVILILFLLLCLVKRTNGSGNYSDYSFLEDLSTLIHLHNFRPPPCFIDA